MHSVVADVREKLAEICRTHGVLRLEVFGSAARGYDFDPETSDVDFLVVFSSIPESGEVGRFFGFKDALENLLGRSVDLVEYERVRNKHLRATINRCRELVFDSHPDVNPM